ncbi:MAG TPA: hypothetical protein H9836_00520 [Candidatus Nocardiopsis merdipullorum]|nr:hypothetical protein [Candidatus Nocardiopsis merdipullorum]
MTAEEHHDDHGNTVSAWFLTVSWIVAWVISAVCVILGGSLILWVSIALGASIVFSVIAGVMKQVGLGRKEPRPVPPTREEWESEREPATTGSDA